MDEHGRLLRSARDGAGRIPAFLDDHGAVALGLLELYTATGERRWLDAAERLVESVRERFADAERGGFFYAAADGEQLIARHKELDDNPTPSGQSLMATVLLRLARLRGDRRMEQEAAAVLRLAEPYLERAAPALGQVLCALGCTSRRHRRSRSWDRTTTPRRRCWWRPHVRVPSQRRLRLR